MSGLLRPVPNDQSPALDAAFTLIRRRFTEKLPLDALAAACQMDKFTFLRAFKKATGRTPCAYIARLRVEHASALIAAGRPLTQAALESGFYDQSHFIRAFKRHYGRTPKTFRIGLDNHLLINSISC